MDNHNPRKLLVFKADPEKYDSDTVGGFLAEIEKKLGDWYEVVYVPQDVELYCPGYEECVRTIDHLIHGMSPELAKEYLQGLLDGIDVERVKDN